PVRPFFQEIEAEGGLADGDQLPLAKNRLAGDRFAVDPRPVERPEVADEPAAVLKEDLRVPARGMFVVKNDDVVAVPAKADRPLTVETAPPGLPEPSFNREQRPHGRTRLLVWASQTLVRF